MFGGEKGWLAMLESLVRFWPRGHQLYGSDLHVRQFPQTLLPVSDHALHWVQLLCHHGNLGLDRHRATVVNNSGVKYMCVCVSSFRLPVAAGWVWLEIQSWEYPGCFSWLMAPSPGGSWGTAMLPELLLWFGTCPPSGWPVDRRPRRTSEGPAHKRLLNTRPIPWQHFVLQERWMIANRPNICFSQQLTCRWETFLCQMFL